MYKNDTNRIKIDIQLENGVYLFNPISATGKTRLYTELRNIYKRTKEVCAYTYDDVTSGLSLSSMVEKCNNKIPKVLMLDKYDLYRNQCSKEIKALRGKCIILIDCKSINKLDDSIDLCTDEIVDIEMQADRIGVIL